MRARRLWTGIAAALMVAGAGVVGSAPAASAAELSEGCMALQGLSGGGGPWVDGTDFTASRPFDLNAGEVVTVRVGFSQGLYVLTVAADGTPFYSVDTSETSAIGRSGSWVVPTSGVHWISENFVTSFAAASSVIYDCGRPVPTAAASPIPAWVQAYGRASADATCIDGWNPSWDQWPNGGTGGFVCVRSIPSFG